jgi:aspartate/methionine/tyrosine aminotransferase
MEAPVQRIRNLIGDKKDIVNLSQGLPWFEPPHNALLKAIERIKNGEADKYGSDEGNYQLRKLILKYLKDKKINSNVSNIVVTPGANQAFFIIMSVIADKDDEIILPIPYYFNHKMAAQILGVKTVEVPVDENYHLSPSIIRDKITNRTKAIVVVSPNNPTGSITDEKIFTELLKLATEFNIFLIVDEAYAYFYWDKPYFSPLMINNSHTIGLFSFSKSFAMSGWRLGFIVCREDLVPEVIKAADTMHICPPIASQILAEEILTNYPDYPNKYRNNVKCSRDILINNLMPLYDEKLISKPFGEGGYYIFIKLNYKFKLSSWEIAELLINNFNIAVIPGEAFGIDNGDIYLRLSYGNIREEQMEIYAKKLAEALYKIRGL